MPGLAGVIQSVDSATATLEVPGAGGTMAATIPDNLDGIAVVGVQAIIEWLPGTPGATASDDIPGSWIITQAGGVPGVIARDGLDPAVQSDIATGVQASGKADTAQAAAQAAQQDANAAKTAAATASSQAGAAQSAAGTAQTTAANAAAAAASAAGIAGGKADVLIQASQPAAAMQKATTLWIDTTSSANTPKTWNGTTWVAVTDKKATDAAAAASSAQGTATQAQQDANAAKANAATAQTAATAAQTAATKAQTTADSKRRSFTATPTPPYDVGDLWTGGPSGELMRCKTAKATGTYSSADWEKASKYTDDTTATAAKAAADAAAAQAGVAIASANGRNISTHSTTDPTTAGVSGKTGGDMWYRHVVLSGKPAGDLSGPVDGQWTWQQGQWIGMTVTAATFASVDGGVATFGSLSGVDIFSPGRSSLPRIHIGGSQLEIVRPVLGPDGTATGASQTTTVLGGQTSDQLSFFDATGNIKGGFDAAGKMTAESVLTGALSLAGTDILDIVQAAPQGPIVGHRFSSSTTQNADVAEHDTVDLFFKAEPGRAYRIIADGAIRASDATFPQVAFRYTSTTDGTKPPRPTLLSPIMKSTRVTGPTAGQSQMGLHMEYVFNLGTSDTETAYRILLTIKSATTDGAFIYAGTTFFVEDLGSTYTGVWADGNTTSDIVKTVEEIISYNIQTATWIDGSLEVRPGDHNHWMKQGWNWNNTGNWGHQCYTNEWIPQAVRDSLSGAQTITSIEVGMSPTLVPFSNDGFVPRIAKSTAAWNNGAPSASVPSASGAFDGVRIPAGGTAWQKLPTGWYGDIATGAITSVQFGTQAGKAGKYAGDFGYTGPLNGQTGRWGICPIRIRYTKSVTS